MEHALPCHWFPGRGHRRPRVVVARTQEADFRIVKTLGSDQYRRGVRRLVKGGALQAAAHSRLTAKIASFINGQTVKTARAQVYPTTQIDGASVTLLDDVYLNVCLLRSLKRLQCLRWARAQFPTLRLLRTNLTLECNQLSILLFILLWNDFLFCFTFTNLLLAKAFWAVIRLHSIFLSNSFAPVSHDNFLE